MNKLIVLVIFISALLNRPCDADYSLSSKELQRLEESDSQFFEKYKDMAPILLDFLKKYRAAAIEKNVDYLYSIRSEAFKKLVSRKIFETILLKNVNMPVRVFYSVEQSLVESDAASLRAYYLQCEGKFEYAITSHDQWKFDSKNGQWILISNSLSWGSSIIKE